jgi:hypothetical protein
MPQQLRLRRVLLAAAVHSPADVDTARVGAGRRVDDRPLQLVVPDQRAQAWPRVLRTGRPDVWTSRCSAGHVAPARVLGLMHPAARIDVAARRDVARFGAALDDARALRRG